MSNTDTTPPPAGPIHDLTQETLLTLAQAARLFPPARRGRPVNSSTLWRWCRRGVRIEGGTVRLECVRISGRWLTSREAISRFVARQTPSALPAPRLRTPGQRQRASERAERELQKLGI
jgi:hypothetical protein